MALSAFQLLFRSVKDFENDSRVLRTGASLSGFFGDASHVIVFGPNDVSFTHDGLHVHVIGQPWWYPFERVIFFMGRQTLSRFGETLLKLIAAVLWIPIHAYWNRRVTELLTSEQPTLVWANDLETLPWGVAYKRTRPDSRLFYDSHEFWIGSRRYIARLGHLRATWAKRTEKRCLRHVDRTITVNQPIADKLVEHYHPHGPVSVLYNIPEPVSPDALPQSPKDLRALLRLSADDRILIFVGRISSGRGVQSLVDAAGELGPSDHLVFVGNGDASLIEAIRNTPYCHYVPSVPPRELLDLVAQADVGICSIEPICESYRLASPNKFWESLQSGLPVVCSDLPVMAGLVREYGLGTLFTPGDRESFLSAIRRVRPKAAYIDAIATFNQQFNYVDEQRKVGAWLAEAHAR